MKRTKHTLRGFLQFCKSRGDEPIDHSNYTACAAGEYVNRNGDFNKPEDLADHIRASIVFIDSAVRPRLVGNNRRPDETEFETYSQFHHALTTRRPA